MVHIHPISIITPEREAHYAAIGMLASNWAALEAIVTSAIWQIGQIEDAIGACITPQISTFDGKLKALVSILEVRRGFQREIDALNKFHRSSQPLATFRNRVIHDPAYFDPETGAPKRLEITANKLPILAYRDAPTAEIAEKAAEVADLIDSFEQLIKPALGRYPPLPFPEKGRRNIPRPK